MTRRIVGPWTVAAILSISTICHATPASAGSVSNTGTIGIKGGFQPGGGDPPYDYYFDIYLTDGSINQGNTITIQNLIGVLDSANEPPNGSSNVYYPNASEGVFLPSLMDTVVRTPANTSTSDDLLTWYGSTVTVTSAPIFLGELVLETFYTNYTTSPYSNGATITYSSPELVPGGTGTFQIYSVPEPSSVVMLLLGAAGLPLMLVHAHRARSKSRTGHLADVA